MTRTYEAANHKQFKQYIKKNHIPVKEVVIRTSEGVKPIFIVTDATLIMLRASCFITKS